ncbi:MAG TPA: homogentisate 1,2-dioxygenase [Polyangiaceae bacterium]|nr:homogentisate 1,2-dioxygenase [Polyangiaceae bacterium]
MLDRRSVGEVPEKPHLRARSQAGAPLYEECITRAGFDGAFSMLYRLHRPHEADPSSIAGSFGAPELVSERPLLRRHYRCLALPAGATSAEARTPLLVNRDVSVGFLRPTEPDRAYFVNADGDELFFVHEGSGVLRSAFGDLPYQTGDYLGIPKGILHRFVPNSGAPHALLWLEFAGSLGVPAHYRNPIGQLRMDAPYTHRDFRTPTAVAPIDEGLRALTVKRRGAWHGYTLAHSPIDAVGWDGAVYPFVFPIRCFSPRVGEVHLPPPVHATFQAAGALVCSFVPRPLDFHPQANPVPFPHSSVDVDEVLFYANDAFTSRRGIGAGSLSHHPAGIPHGPHPGAYENETPETRTREIAVMLDCSAPLDATRAAASIEDAGYHASFRA